MLATLHLALLLGTQSAWARPLLFAHLGIFLLWQPLWHGESQLRPGSILFIGGASLVALLWLNWWVLAFWASGLFALVGGRVFAFHTRWQRWRYLLAMAYLLAVLLLWVTPHLFELPVIVDAASNLMGLLLPLLLALMLLPKEKEQADAAQIVDFIYSLLLFLLVTLLVLGSLAFMTLARVDYFEALLRTLFILAVMLFVLGWLWNPRLGFSGLQPIFSRYLPNIGTPFEAWLKHLAGTAQQEPNPAVFLARAVARPFLSGQTARTAPARDRPLAGHLRNGLAPHVAHRADPGQAQGTATGNRCGHTAAGDLAGWTAVVERHRTVRRRPRGRHVSGRTLGRAVGGVA